MALVSIGVRGTQGECPVDISAKYGLFFLMSVFRSISIFTLSFQFMQRRLKSFPKPDGAHGFNCRIKNSPLLRFIRLLGFNVIYSAPGGRAYMS